MQDNRNFRCGLGNDSQGTICIDTKRVLDCCRDRDCFENARVYLTPFGEETIAAASNVRTKAATIVCAYVGVEPVPFNTGFYKVTVRYYIRVDLEACVYMSRSQCFSGIAIIEKDVILFGGEGSVVSYYSNPDSSYCCTCGNTDNTQTNDPIAVVETVQPVVLNTRVADCTPQPCCTSCCCESAEIPESVCGCIDGQLVTNSQEGTPRLFVSFGVFSVIRIERSAQILVEATDYSVPDKECAQATSNDDPCSLFNSMPFPVNQFKTLMSPLHDSARGQGNCGCSSK